MPDAREIGRLGIACCRRAKERKSRAIIVSGDDLGEFSILDSKWCSRVFRLRPVQPAVLGDSDLRVAIRVNVAEVDRVVAARRNRRIAPWTDALGVGYGPHDPTQAVVRRDGHTWPARVVRVKAMFIGDVDRTVGRDPDVTVQAAAGPRPKIDAVDF